MSSKASKMKSVGRKAKCGSCGTRFYYLQRENTVPCPVCGVKVNTERRFFNIRPDSKLNTAEEFPDMSDTLTE